MNGERSRDKMEYAPEGTKHDDGRTYVLNIIHHLRKIGIDGNLKLSNRGLGLVAYKEKEDSGLIAAAAIEIGWNEGRAELWENIAHGTEFLSTMSGALRMLNPYRTGFVRNNVDVHYYDAISWYLEKKGMDENDPDYAFFLSNLKDYMDVLMDLILLPDEKREEHYREEMRYFRQKAVPEILNVEPGVTPELEDALDFTDRAGKEFQIAYEGVREELSGKLPEIRLPIERLDLPHYVKSFFREEVGDYLVMPDHVNGIYFLTVLPSKKPELFDDIHFNLDCYANTLRYIDRATSLAGPG